MEGLDCARDFLAVVDYAHKPGALQAVLQTLREQNHGRLAVVFGAGGNRDAGKREPIGPRIAASWPIWWSSPTTIPRDEIPRRSGPPSGRGAADLPAEVVEIRRPARGDRHVRRLLGRPGDVVLIAGKGHESGQTGGGVTRPFDDRIELAGALIALGHRR
jgi:UDP-N-acetylmuramoyl-L-alanyl-D-glutamate--2,6-diaminopimelate ligase